MPPKIVTFFRKQAERLLAVRPPETVVVELLVTATHDAVAGLRKWADQQGIDMNPAAQLKAGDGDSSFHLRQVQVLQGRADEPVSHQVVSAWEDDLQRLVGVRVVSMVSRSQARSTWKKVLAQGDQAPREFALVPPGERDDETKRKAAERLGVPASELRIEDSRSWHLRSSYSRFLASCLLVIVPLCLAWLIALAVPTVRSTGLLLGGVLLATCGLAYLVRDQGVQVIGAQLALLLGALATVSYAACRWAYYVYYEDFGTTPEEVGLDYRTILSNQPLFVVSAVLIVLVVALSCYAFAAALNQFSDTLQQKLASCVAVVILVGGSTALVPFLSITRDAHRAAEAVRAGGTPSTAALFFWPDPRRVALASASAPTPGTAQAAPSATLAGADLRLLGGDSSTWAVLDVVTGSTLRLPRVSSPLVLAPAGVTRIVTLTPQGFRPSRLLVPPGSSQDLAVYNETGKTCQAVPGPYRSHQRGQSTMFELSVPGSGRMDVRIACAGASDDQLPVQQTLTLSTKNE